MCSRCPSNTFQDETGQTDCKACPTGSSRSASEDASQCICDIGHGSANGACSECVVEQTFKSFRGNEACVKCDECPSGQSPAEKCTSSRNTMCVCAAGSSGPGQSFVAGTAACESCQLGTTFQDSVNASECKACDDCAASEQKVDDCNLTTNTRCQCAPGHAGREGPFSAELSSCTQCASGQTFQDAPGSANCKDCHKCSDGAGMVEAVGCSISQDVQCKCDVGFAGHTGAFVFGSAQCSACGNNQYQPSQGKESCIECTDCPSGSVEVNPCSSTLNKQCECSAGHAGHAGAFSAHDGSCSECAANTYQSGQGEESCDACPDHSSRAAGSDATACQCDAGYTGEGTAQSACQACPANTYKSATGSGDCTACPSLSTSPAGSTSIGDCQCNSNTARNGDVCEQIFFRSGSIEQISLDAKDFSYSSVANPVVFVSPLTYNGGHIAVVRLDAGTGSYTAKIAEPTCLDGVHPAKEDFHWLVMERGTHSYGGATMAAFTQDNISIEDITTVNFPTGAFSAAPTCISFIQTNANKDMFLSTRIVSTGASSLQVIIEPDEKTKKQTASWPTKETIGFLCVEKGKTDMDGFFGKFSVRSVETTNGETTRSFSTSIDTDHVFAHMVSRRGPNPAIVRHTTYSNSNLSFRLQEDTCNDSETWHVGETVAVLGFPNN